MTTNERIDRLLNLNDQMQDELHSLRNDLMQPLSPPVIVPSQRDETAEEVAERNARQKQFDEEFYRTHPKEANVKRFAEAFKKLVPGPTGPSAITNDEAEKLMRGLATSFDQMQKERGPLTPDEKMRINRTIQVCGLGPPIE